MKLHELAELAGVAPRWQDWRGEQREQQTGDAKARGGGRSLR